MNTEKTGKLIHDLRIKNGMTQQELAESLNVSPSTISKWENGHSFPDISMLEPLATKLNASISEIIIGESDIKHKIESPDDLEQTTADASDRAVKSVIEVSIIQRYKSNLTIIKISAAIIAVVFFIVLSLKLLDANYDILIECGLIFVCLVLIAVCSVIQLVRLEVNKHSKTSTKLMIIAVPVIAVIMLIAVIGNSLFPKASPITVPFSSEIASVNISGEHGTSEAKDMDIVKVCSFLSDVKPTRKQSYDDNPSTRPYYTIEINTPSNSYHYFIYSEGSSVYIEVPYGGIYKSSNEALDYIVSLSPNQSGSTD